MKREASFIRVLEGTFIHGVPYSTARNCLAGLEGHGVDLTYTDLMRHHLAGGRIQSLVDGIIFAHENGVKMTISNAKARDLYAGFKEKMSLTDHIRSCLSSGFRDLDYAPLDPKARGPNNSPEATPGQRPPPTLSPSSGAPQL